MVLETVAVFLALGLSFYILARRKRAKQLAFIQAYEFHPALERKLKEKYAHLNDSQVKDVFDCLRDYFTFCNQARRRVVAMPSQVVDVAWHEFILFTKAYEAFSRHAIGRFLHHTPTEAMKSQTMAQQGIKRAWRLACANERIDPATPVRLPRIFAIDTRLNIEDGFKYSVDCKDRSSPYYGIGYCAGHIACASGCAGDSGDSTSSGGSGSGSDCGGSGCGGD